MLKPTNLTVEAWVRSGIGYSNTPTVGRQYIVFKEFFDSDFEGYDLSKTRVLQEEMLLNSGFPLRQLNLLRSHPRHSSPPASGIM